MLTFDISHQIITRTDDFRVVADSRNYLTATFLFSPEWDGKNKTAVFSWEGKNFHTILENDACLVPWEVIRPELFTVSVFGGELITTNQAIVDVIPSGGGPADMPEAPSPSVYEALSSGKADNLSFLSNILRLTAQGKEIGDGILIRAGNPGKVIDFVSADFAPYMGKYRMVVTRESHGLGHAVIVQDCLGLRESGAEKVSYHYAQLPNGDIVLYASEPFDGKLILEGVEAWH